MEPPERLAMLQKEKAASDGLAAALQSLDERSREIIKSRWLVQEGEGKEKTLHELAEEFGVSAERIRQIEAKAMQKMKAALSEYDAIR